MDVNYINPFIESVSELFSSMLACEATLDNVQKAEPMLVNHEIIGLIGLSGAMRGTVALIFPVPTAMCVIERFIGTPVKQIDSTLIDAVAELVNIVAGGAKARLSTDGNAMNLSIPNVIRGMGGTVLAPSWATWIEVAFKCELGPFQLRVTMGK